MILQTRWVSQELFQKYVGRRELDGAVADAGILMEVLPKGTPIVTPPSSVRHESKVGFRAGPVVGW